MWASAFTLQLSTREVHLIPEIGERAGDELGEGRVGGFGRVVGRADDEERFHERRVVLSEAVNDCAAPVVAAKDD